MIKNKSTLWSAALITAWSVDFLFWGKAVGVSFVILMAITLSAVLIAAYKEGTPPAKKSLWLLPLVLIFSSLSFIRQEPFTHALNYLMSFFLLGAFLYTFRGGRWLEYNLSDWVIGGLKLALNTFILAIQFVFLSNDTQKEGDAVKGEVEENEAAKKPSIWKKAAPYLRGLLLALPVLAILTSLLASADAIFAERVKELLRFISWEYFFRAIFILILTFPVAGAFLHALTESQDEELIGIDKPWPPRFLGFIESVIVLGSVNLLFFSFVTIQFRYFFGGESNISLQGMTYSEYARRGFGELLAVAFFTLLLFITLSAITKRENKGQRRTFSALTTALTLFIGVILLSSLYRLGLYENAYGFTRLRTYSHICIIWIAILFLGILILELIGKWRYFTLAALLAVMGFVLSMSAINVDGFITRQNLARAFNGKKLDTYHLQSLSNDAIPDLVNLGEDARLSLIDRAEIGGILACRDALLETPRHWQSFTWSTYQANKSLQENASLWNKYLTYKDEYDSWYVIIEGESRYCSNYGWD
ncbi:MAG: hypothetical protein B6243_06935 [Anaerolineaceae bacterium 4572_5.2]|nr:MAG: hypothetical protein B6243_06935 [Anaerolineaceae bacterium 4572_5.2]